MHALSLGGFRHRTRCELTTSLFCYYPGCMPCCWADPGTSLLVQTPHTSLSLDFWVHALSLGGSRYQLAGANSPHLSLSLDYHPAASQSSWWRQGPAIDRSWVRASAGGAFAVLGRDRKTSRRATSFHPDLTTQRDSVCVNVTQQRGRCWVSESGKENTYAKSRPLKYHQRPDDINSNSQHCASRSLLRRTFEHARLPGASSHCRRADC